MITEQLKQKIDQTLNIIWTGGASNTITKIEQLSCLIFIKNLVETETHGEGINKLFIKDKL